MNDKLKHTPAWEVITDIDQFFCVRNKNGQTICECSWTGSMKNRYHYKEASKANAKLIASAPEMLNALIEILKKQKEKCPKCNMNCTGLKEICDVMKYKDIIEKATELKIEEILK